MTAPAFYSYFKNRDELIENLVIDAYESYQRALESARDQHSEKDPANRIMSVYLAYREWAITHPKLFGLFAGREVPGFKPPEGRIAEKAETMIRIFMSLFREAWDLDLLKKPDQALPLSEEYRLQFSSVRKKLELTMPMEIVDSVIHIAFLVHGTISMEISGRFKHVTEDFSVVYRYQVANELARIGLKPDF